MEGAPFGRYQLIELLASPESADNRAFFAQLMLDEAFSKSDPQFAQQARVRRV